MKIKNKKHNILAIALIAGICFFSACGHKQIPQTAEASFVEQETESTVTLNCVGYGHNEKVAAENAKLMAINTILFKGIPGDAVLRLPMIENENEAKKTHKKYFKNFYNNGVYYGFITNFASTSKLVKVNGTKRMNASVTINYVALRKDLEQGGVVRKFGF